MWWYRILEEYLKLIILIIVAIFIFVGVFFVHPKSNNFIHRICNNEFSKKTSSIETIYVVFTLKNEALIFEELVRFIYSNLNGVYISPDVDDRFRLSTAVENISSETMTLYSKLQQIEYSGYIQNFINKRITPYKQKYSLFARTTDSYEEEDSMNRYYIPSSWHVLSQNGPILKIGKYASFNCMDLYCEKDDFLKLKVLYKSKGMTFTNIDLEKLILIEKRNQEYAEFKKIFTSKSVNNIQDYINIFAKAYSDDIDEILEFKSGSGGYLNLPQALQAVKKINVRLYFLIKLLNENNLQNETNLSSLVEALINRRSYCEIDKFEKDLMTANNLTIDDVDIMDGISFENFLKKLFEQMGYVVEVTKTTGDQGADLLIRKMGEIIVVQAKRYGSSVGNSAIQEVVASIAHYKADKGMVVTNNSFTSSAISLAKSNKIELINRDKLITLMKEHL